MKLYSLFFAVAALLTVDCAVGMDKLEAALKSQNVTVETRLLDNSLCTKVTNNIKNPFAWISIRSV